MNPLFKLHNFTVTPGLAALKFPVIGDFIFIETAAAGFELSFDNTNFIPIREGRMIKTNEPFDAFWVRAAGSAVNATAITGNGNLSSFASYGTFNPAIPAATAPFGSYAELGNVLTADLQTGVYSVVITGAPPVFEVWQLRAWTDGGTPVTDTGNGLIVPVDYSGANKRVWRRAL